MLLLLSTRPGFQDGAALSATVPGALLVHLALADGAWVPREALAARFWPEVPLAEAQHHLRINLHRARQWATRSGAAQGLAAERQRLRWHMPSDVSQLRAALRRLEVAPQDPAAQQQLLAHAPVHGLAGLGLNGFEAAQAWTAQAGQALRRDWCRRVAHTWPLLMQAGQLDQARPVWACWLAVRRQAGEDTAVAEAARTALALTAGLPLDDAARRLWHQCCQEDAELAGEARSRAGPPIVGSAASPLAFDTSPGPAGALRDAAAGVAQGAAVAQVPAALVGRDALLRHLLRHPAPAVVIQAEPGMGKSALLAQAYAGRPWLRGREGLDTLPYRPLLVCLRDRLPQLRRRCVHPADPLHPYRLDLARLLPELAPDEALPPLDALTAKARLLEALARALEPESLLVVDDLQWLDGATLEWLVWLADGRRLPWRATMRTEGGSPTVPRALAPLEARGLLVRLNLPALTEADSARLCRESPGGQDWSEAQVQHVHRLSGGNPFVLLALAARGPAAITAAGPADLPEPVSRLVRQRILSQPPALRALLEAAAVLDQPLPLAALVQVAHGRQAPADPQQLLQAAEHGLAAGLLAEWPGSDGLACAHDLLRHGVLQTLGATRRAWLHRQAALTLAGRPGAAGDALRIAHHWAAAGEPQTALAWQLRGAAGLKELGRFAEARQRWQTVADEAQDLPLALQARKALATCDLMEDLAQGRLALQAVLAEVDAVADPLVHDQIAGSVLAGLVDNAVYRGDLAEATALAARLQPLLPRLREEDRPPALEALMELAMRQPDFAAARVCLARLRQLAPRRLATLSLQAQLAFMEGELGVARQAFEHLRTSEPQAASALTLDSDLAVVLWHLGRPAAARVRAEAAVAQWQGVPHAEAYAQLALGSVLCSLAEPTAAEAALRRALALAQAQGSPMLASEAWLRLARLALRAPLTPARQALAAEALTQAGPGLEGCLEPLRLSHAASVAARWQAATGQPPPGPAARWARALQQLDAARCAHPLVQVRLAFMAWADARHMGLSAQAALHAERWQGLAEQADLLEWQTEGAWRAAQSGLTSARERGALADLALARGLPALAAEVRDTGG